MLLRIGQAIDVHAFAEGPAERPLVLGGVEIPGAPGLAGHSDADVVLHALCDGLLGAIGQGDIGTLFGTDDPVYADAASSVFATAALARVVEAGFGVGNVDLTIVAQRPRLAAHQTAIRASVAAVLAVEEARVNVKVTSTDSLGAIGRGEGIACLLVVLLEQVN